MTSAFDQFERLTSIESADRRIEYTYDPRGRIIGRSAKQKSSGPPSPPWVPETRAYLLTDDGLPANTTWVWDPVVDRLIAIYEAGKSTIPPGSTSPPAADAGLLRQYIHGDRAYDDPVQVLIASADGASPVKYFPIVDEVATGSLQAVLDKDGNVVERVLYGDSYGDAPRYLQGPTVDSITYASSTGGSVDIRVHTSEKIKQMTVAGGSRLVALKGDGSVSATAATPATLDADQITLHWHLSSGEWSSLTAGAQSIEVAVTSTLRTYSWGDVPFAPVPELGRRLYGAKSASNTPVAVQSSITYLSTLSGSGSEEPLYEIRSPYLAGVDYSKTKLLTAFHSLPFNEPANGLIFARTRWYDPATGTFITPDPLGYRDASSLYAFAGGDPVNHRDPSGMGEEQSARAGEILARDPYIQCTVGNALGSLKGTAKTAWGFVAGAASLAWQGTVGVDDPSAANAALDDAQDFLFHPIKRWHKVSDEVVSKQASGDCFGAGETLQEKFVAPVTVTVVGGVEMVRGGLKTVPKVEETPPTLTPVPSEPAPPVPETAPKVPPAVRKVPGLTGLRFGRNDLVYGPSARGYLRALQQEAGGVLLDDLPKPPELSWEEFTVKTMNEAAETGRNIRFDLTHMEDLEGVLNNQGPWKNTVTAVELRYLKANWARFSKVAHFYVNGVEVKPPWVK
jgi:RHS repeat-associated protein